MLTFLLLLIAMTGASAEGDQDTRASPASLRPRQKKQLIYDVLEVLAATIPGGGVPGLDYPILSSVPRTKFSCHDYVGYFADRSPEARCQVYYVCQGANRRDAFLCPNGTIFNQGLLICDWWFNVECGPISGAVVDEHPVKSKQIAFIPSTIETNPNRPLDFSLNVSPSTTVVQSSLESYVAQDKSEKYKEIEDDGNDKTPFTIYHNTVFSEKQATAEKNRFEPLRPATTIDNDNLKTYVTVQATKTGNDASQRPFHEGNAIPIARTYELPVFEYSVINHPSGLHTSSHNTTVGNSRETYTTEVIRDSTIFTGQGGLQVYEIPGAVTATYADLNEYATIPLVSTAYSTQRKTTAVPTVSAKTPVQNIHNEPKSEYTVLSVATTYPGPLDRSVPDFKESFDSSQFRVIYLDPTPTSDLYEKPKDEASITSDLYETLRDEALITSDLYETPSDEDSITSDLYETRDDTSVTSELYETRDDTSVTSELYETRDDTSVTSELYETRDDASVTSELYEAPRDEASISSDLYETPRDEAPIILTNSRKSPLDHLLMHMIIQEAEKAGDAFGQVPLYETPEIPRHQSSRQITQGVLKVDLNYSSRSSEEDSESSADESKYSTAHDIIQDSTAEGHSFLREETYSPKEEEYPFQKREFSPSKQDYSRENVSPQKDAYPPPRVALSPPQFEYSPTGNEDWPPQNDYSPHQGEYSPSQVQEDPSLKDYSVSQDSSPLIFRKPTTGPKYPLSPTDTISISKSTSFGPLFRHIVLANSFPLSRYAPLS
ncbi:uncharacterized protein LOC135208234 [Macrobrachium nipponense]|uniref:uncharacterized protein LOC135208234 n=1 Tax=Macrobrachium nipponense TaxID=159736 RepID=UPI0030C85402